MESFVERFRAKATKARQAQSRLKALERMQRIAPAHVASPAFEFCFAEPAKLPSPLLVLDGQSVGYGERALLTGCSLTILPGDRIALLGRNGAGKSTFMKLLAGLLVASGGTRSEARDLTIGYFAQHHLEQLQPAESALQSLRRVGAERAARQTEQELRDFLASFGFRGERVFEPLGPFSGGEKARLVLALVSYLRPNLLLLDEPTNHLDLEMRQALAVALQEYSGAVVLVSHDRHLLNSVADQLYLVDGGRVLPFDGDLEDYARWAAGGDSARAATAPLAPAAPSAAAVAAPATAAVESAAERKQRKRDEALLRAKLAPLRTAASECERELERLAGERARIEAALQAPDLYGPQAREQLAALLQRQRDAAVALGRAEERWLEAHAALEAAEWAAAG
jgi:ATP-binding cassette subfamily F protein 3